MKYKFKQSYKNNNFLKKHKYLNKKKNKFKKNK